MDTLFLWDFFPLLQILSTLPVFDNGGITFVVSNTDYSFMYLMSPYYMLDIMSPELHDRDIIIGTVAMSPRK